MILNALSLTPPQTKITENGITPIKIGTPCFENCVDKEGATGITPFVDLVKDVAQDTRDALLKSESLSQKAAAGKADPQAVATSVVEARAALQQFTALLHAATNAYQEVMRLAI